MYVATINPTIVHISSIVLTCAAASVLVQRSTETEQRKTACTLPIIVMLTRYRVHFGRLSAAAA